MNLSWWTLDYSSATHAPQTLQWKGKGKGHLTSMSSVPIAPTGPTAPTYEHHETVSFMISLPAINVLCFSRMGGIGGGGWVHQKCAKSTVTSGLISRNDVVGTENAISVLFGLYGVRNEQSHIVGPLFPVFKACFSAIAGWLSLET